MNVVLSAAAREDLIGIADYIAADSPARALTFVEELIDCCNGLAVLPTAFPLVPRYESHGVRRRPYGNDLIFYRVEATSVQVLHILHGGRDYEATLFPTT